MSNEMIETKSNKFDRSVETNTPDILSSDATLDDIVNALGDELAKNKLQSQLKVDFRSQVRTKLESKDDNGDFRYSDADLTEVDYSDWAPELKQRKSAEEKVADMFSNMTPDQIKAALAKAGKEVE